MTVFISILAFLFLISCSGQESEGHFPKSMSSDSSIRIQSADSSVRNSEHRQISASSFAEESSSSQEKFSLSVKNAGGSGEYRAGETVVIALKKPGKNLCADPIEVMPRRYKKSLEVFSEDSATFTMPSDSVKIFARFRPCLSNVPSIVIGSLRWMTRNVNIPTPSGSICYDRKNSNCKKYGRLYDFKTAQEICTDGWRLPTDAEWTAMTEALGENDGQKLKTKNGWASEDETSGNGTDSVHFHALPSGIVYESSFMYLGHHAYFWTATERDENTAYYRSLSYDSQESYRYYNFKTAGYAVRCVQDVR